VPSTPYPALVAVAAQCEIPLVALKQLIAHSAASGDVTMGYVNLPLSELRRAAQKVCDRIKELCGIEMPETGTDDVVRMEQRA